jgi:predicted GNAT family N-acyltransferase
MSHFTIRRADWDDPADRDACIAVRREVFVVEQRVPEDQELDRHDAESLHVLARDAAGAPVGTGRLLPDGHLGRMAVLAAWRGRGVGDAIVRALLLEAYARGDRESVLSAQVHAIPFYERFGYRAEGEVYDDCGIPHRDMRLALGAAQRPAELERARPAPAVRRLRAVAQAQAAALELVRLARHRVAILTPDLEPALYSSPEVRDELSRVARSSRFASVRILVRDVRRAVREGHHLVELADQLSSYVHVRVPAIDDEPTTDAFLIADDDAILYRPVGDRPEGVVEVGASALARERLRSFDRLWERAEPHPDLRRLGI